MEERPKTRGDCVDAVRPCPWAGCRYHLLVDVTKPGSITLAGKHGGFLAPATTRPAGLIEHFLERAADLVAECQGETCALDLAEREGVTLEVIAQSMSLTRERVRQIESRALARIGGSSAVLRILGDSGEVGRATRAG